MRILAAMARVLIVSENRPLIGGHKPGEWLHARASQLCELPSVARVDVHRLVTSASGSEWSNWLVELEGAATEAIEGEEAVVELLGDLRVLGMRPHVLVVKDEAT
jgi:hypothetical protein